MLLTVGAAAFEVSCVSAGVAPEVISYDRAIAKAENEMLLLNIVRAAKWNPLYLVDLTKSTGSLKGELGGKVGYQLIGGADDNASANSGASISGTYSVNPTFDVNVLTSKEFIQGFRQPVSAEELASLVDQGWRPELLFHLFVRERTVQIGEKTKQFRNRLQVQESTSGEDEEGNKDFKDFSSWVTAFCACQPRVVTCEGKGETIGPAVQDGEVKKLGTLVDIGKAGLRLERTKEEVAPSGYQLLGKEEGRVGEIVPGGQTHTCATGFLDNKVPREEPAAAHLKGKDCDGNAATFRLRSPDAVLRYLGGLVRFESHERKIPQLVLCLGPREKRCTKYEVLPLFVAVQTNVRDRKTTEFLKGKKAAVKVTDDDGDSYLIPQQSWPLSEKGRATTMTRDGDAAFEEVLLPEEKCGGPGMSPDVLAIVSQLISLHKSAKDLGLTPVVRTVGQ